MESGDEARFHFIYIGLIHFNSASQSQQFEITIQNTNNNFIAGTV